MLPCARDRKGGTVRKTVRMEDAADLRRQRVLSFSGQGREGQAQNVFQQGRSFRPDLRRNLPVQQVFFIKEQDQRLFAFSDPGKHGKVFLLKAFRQVGKIQHEVRVFDRLLRAPDPDLFDRVVGGPEAGGVHEHEAQLAEAHRHLQHVTRRPRDLGHDGLFMPGKEV